MVVRGGRKTTAELRQQGFHCYHSHNYMSEDKNVYLFMTIETLQGNISSGTWKGESEEQFLEQSMENGFAVIFYRRLASREAFDKINAAQDRLKSKIMRARIAKI